MWMSLQRNIWLWQIDYLLHSSSISSIFSRSSSWKCSLTTSAPRDAAFSLNSYIPFSFVPLDSWSLQDKGHYPTMSFLCPQYALGLRFFMIFMIRCFKCLLIQLIDLPPYRMFSDAFCFFPTQMVLSGPDW